MLTEFFHMNATNADAKNLNCLYIDFPRYFVWHSIERMWTTRKQGEVIGRLTSAHPTEGERYYLRMLLMHIPKPTSFNDLKTFNGENCHTFQEAAEKRGLLQVDNGADECLQEACIFQMPYSLRQLFAILLVHVNPSNPIKLWKKYKEYLSEDIKCNKIITIEEIEIKVLQKINEHLKSMGKTIDDYNFAPYKSENLQLHTNTKEIETEYNIIVFNEDLATISMLNSEQKKAYDIIMDRIHNNKSGVFFLDGPGGTGKTFLYRALLATIRSTKNIALATATSGVAASILPGGRTAHSRFKIPIKFSQSDNCSISKQSSTSELIKKAKLIIWDEATMAKKNAIHCLNDLLKDIMECEEPFGGKVVVFGGDFRQTLPVVRKGQKDDYISASLVTSNLWEKFE